MEKEMVNFVTNAAFAAFEEQFHMQFCRIVTGAMDAPDDKELYNRVLLLAKLSNEILHNPEADVSFELSAAFGTGNADDERVYASYTRWKALRDYANVINGE